MIKNYFKQAWQLLKENKLYSTIYIFGTALAICMVMVISVFLFIKRGNITPEVHRSRSLYVQSIETTPKDTTDHSNSSSLASYNTLKEVFYPLETAETVTAHLLTFGEDYSLTRVNEEKGKSVITKFVDANFWKAFGFNIVEGEPFNEADFQSGIKKIVIDESTSRKLFNGASPIGEQVLLNDEVYRICAVVRNTSYMLSDTFANVWVPYTCRADYELPWDEDGVLGMYKITIVAPSMGDFAKVRNEANERAKQFEEGLACHVRLLGQPEDALTASFRFGSRSVDLKKILTILGIMTTILALVPVLNLSGLNSSRMEKRSAEIGVRKAFGGTKGHLVVQMIIENLLLTLLGGVVGLLLSYIVLHFISNLLISPMAMLGSSNLSGMFSNNLGITPRMLFNMEIFFIALVAVFIINVLSTLLPSYRYARKNIVEALSEHK